MAKDGGATTDPAIDLEPTASPEEVSKADILVETGLTPEEYILQAIEEHEGQLEQQAITDLADWSEATVSRTLKGMEEQALVTRIQIGRENVVFLPDAAPDVDAETTDEPPIE